MSYASVPDFIGGTELTAAELNVLVDAFNALFPVGFYGYLCRAATTSETLVNGVWLECNGLSVLRATYPDLNTLLSSLSYPFGSADGTHMTLPDAQGRSLVNMASSGHADVSSLNKNDGYTKTTRRPTHNHTSASTSVTGSGTSTGSFVFGSSSTSVQSGSGSSVVSGLNAGTVSSTLSLSGGGVSRVGPTGTNPSDVTPYLVAGTLFIKCKA